jgi:hypothetical protein
LALRFRLGGANVERLRTVVAPMIDAQQRERVGMAAAWPVRSRRAAVNLLHVPPARPPDLPLRCNSRIAHGKTSHRRTPVEPDVTHIDILPAVLPMEWGSLVTRGVT